MHQKLESMDGSVYPMTGLIEAEAYRTEKLSRFGYVVLYDRKGRRVAKGHEFHYWDSTCPGSCLKAVKPLSTRSWDCMHVEERMIAGFPHLYYKSNPDWILQFLEAEINKKADAERYKVEQEAAATLAKRQREAEAKKYEQEKEAEAMKAKAQAEADAMKAKALAEAEALKAKAEATRFAAEQEATGIRAKGEAEAASIQAKALAEAAIVAVIR